MNYRQTEALTLADRIVCMSMGHVQQVGTPLELYDTPNNIFVASFIGLPPMNLFDVAFEDGKLKGKGFEAPLTDEQKDVLSAYDRKTITLGVRPEDVCEGEGVRLKVTTNENLGMNTLVQGYMGEGNRITAKLRGWTNYRNGDEVSVQFGKMHFFDKETTNAIRKGAK